MKLLRELLELNEVTRQQLVDVEAFADRLWGKLGIEVTFTKHFIERLHHERNGKEITAAELIRLFKKEYEQYGKEVKQIDDEGTAVFTDLLTDVNLPFVVKDDGGEKELIAKTVMRKKGFTTSTQMYKVK